MSYLTDLTDARDNVAALIKDLTENPKPTYSVGGQNVSWESYLSTLIGKLEELNKAVQAAGSPFSVHHRGRIG